MSSVLQIYQYQTVDFTDTSTGALPLTRVWSFPGGTPTTSTTNPENVQYLVPGTYTVTLTETDAFGTTKSLIQTNVIQVSPSSVTASISGPTPSSVKMDEDYMLYDTSTGIPFSPSSWLWTLPYSRTATTQNVGVTGYGDWFTLTGTYSGSPGSIYEGQIVLQASSTISGTTISDIATTSIDVSKLGPQETLYLNATGGSSTGYQTGLSGGILVYPGNLPARASDFGYPADQNLILKLNFVLRGVGNNTNSFFHSTNESSTLQIFTGLWSLNNMDIINGFLVIQAPIYTQFSFVPVNSAISLGQYIIANQSSDLFFVDQGGFFLNLYDNYNYSTDLLSYLIVNPYKIIFSGNIQYVNISNSIAFVDTGGGSNSNPVVYSPAALSALGIPAPSAIYQITITINMGGGPTTITVPFGTAGSTGNDPVTGNYYVAQDNSNGLGIVTRINNAITAAFPPFPGGTSFLEFEANPIFSIYNGTGYDPTGFNGIAMKIKDKAVISVTITDNSATLTSLIPPSPLSPTVAPFLINPLNNRTCTGMATLLPNGMIMNNSPFNQIDFGGSIYQR
jgi:hypothetical protein